MREYLLVLKFFFLFSAVSAQTEWSPDSPMDYSITGNLEFYSENDLWGIQTRRNKPVTPALYDTLIEVSEEHILARRWITSEQQLLWGTLNNEGKQLIPFQYKELEPHKQVFICGEQKNNFVEYGLLSSDGRVIVNTTYEDIEWVSDNRYAARKNGLTTVLNADGKKVIQITADSVAAVSDRLLQIWHSGKTGLISTEGDRLTPISYARLNHQGNKILAASYPDWFVINNGDTSFYNYERIIRWNESYIVTGNNNQWLISPEDSAISSAYDKIFNEDPHVAIVKRQDHYGAISNNGRKIIAPTYDSLIYNQGYFLAQKGVMKPTWSLIDTFGIVKTSFSYELIRNPNEGLFAIKRKEKWGYINQYGVEVIPAIYDKVSDFESGLAHVTYFGEQGIIDLEGKWVLKPRNEEIQCLGSDRYLGNSYGLSFIKTFDGEYVYFTKNALFMSNNLIHELDSTGQIIKRVTWEGTFVYDTEDFTPQYGASEGFAIIRKNNKFGFVDVKGLLRIAYRYDSVKVFSEGLAPVKLNGHWGFINKMEAIVVQPQYDEVRNFNNGHAAIIKDDKMGVITNTGEEIIPAIYDKIESAPFGYYIVYSGKKIGVLNNIGAAILHPRYDYLEIIDEEVIIVKRRGEYGVVDMRGINVAPMQYSYLGYDKKSRSFIYKQPASEAKLVYQFSAL